MTSPPIDFFGDRKNVEEYIAMCEGMDGRELIEILKKFLKPQSTVLELGIGPGTDLEILNETFRATGSDNSKVFLNIYRDKHRDSDLLHLNAVTLKTDRKFDCIYSNKVLHHMMREDLPKSFERQLALLNEDGILFHSFWLGDEEEEFQGLRFVKYQIDQLVEITKPNYDLIESGLYAEMNKDDSFYLILKRKTNPG